MTLLTGRLGEPWGLSSPDQTRPSLGAHPTVTSPSLTTAMTAILPPSSGYSNQQTLTAHQTLQYNMGFKVYVVCKHIRRLYKYHMHFKRARPKGLHIAKQISTVHSIAIPIIIFLLGHHSHSLNHGKISENMGYCGKRRPQIMTLFICGVR